MIAENTAAALFNPILALPLATLTAPKPPKPPMPLPKPPNPPKPAVGLELGATVVLVLGALLPGAPTPIGDLEGDGGATGSEDELSEVLTEGGKTGLVDIVE